jgi:hypothetical protein
MKSTLKGFLLVITVPLIFIIITLIIIYGPIFNTY